MIKTDSKPWYDYDYDYDYVSGRIWAQVKVRSLLPCQLQAGTAAVCTLYVQECYVYII